MLSDYFNVSIDYLLGKSDTKKEPADSELTLSELLKQYADPDTETLLLFAHGIPIQRIKVKKEDMDIVRSLVEALQKKYDSKKESN